MGGRHTVLMLNKEIFQEISCRGLYNFKGWEVWKGGNSIKGIVQGKKKNTEKREDGVETKAVDRGRGGGWIRGGGGVVFG